MTTIKQNVETFFAEYESVFINLMKKGETK